jgi:hypothetical protein
VLNGTYPPGTVGTYQVVESEAVWVRAIFREFAAHGSLNRVARWLNTQQVPPPGKPRRQLEPITASEAALVPRTRCWRITSVRFVLTNPVYVGRACFGRTESLTDEHRTYRRDQSRTVKHGKYRRDRPEDAWTVIDAPPLVSDEVWAACQARLTQNADERKSLFGGNSQRKRMLSSLARCPVCGRRMGYKKAYPNKHPAYYTCEKSDCPKPRPYCYVPHRADRMERLTADGMVYLAHHPQHVADSLAAYDEVQRQQAAAAQAGSGDSSDQDGAERERLTGVLAELGRREEAIAGAQIEARLNGRPSDVYDRMLADVVKQRGEAQARLKTIAPRPVSPVVSREEARDTAAKLAAVTGAIEMALTVPDEDYSPAEKQALLARIVRSVTPHEDGVDLSMVTETTHHIKTA